MRDASEDMRSAAGDLRRQDPGQASERGSRALDKLREAERQMQASMPDEGKRARGDMQLEARQLAEAEREIESELGRLGQGEAAKDAMRRLAGEQERLAERAERLQQGLGRQAATPGDSREQAERRAQQAVAEAARDFDRQQVDERMQQAAQALRAEAQGSGGKEASTGRPAGEQAVTSQDLAKALDRLADRLAAADGTGDAESQKLSDQLARAQELREKIDELTGQLQRLGQAGSPQSGSPDGAQAPSGGAGRSGQGGPGGVEGLAIGQLREEYTKQLREARDLLDELGRDNTPGGSGLTFEAPGNMTLSAPGTEAFKQDFARWETLRKQATMALERAQLSISQKLQEKLAHDRLATGVDDKAPDVYQQQVDSYFKALATGRKP
jgi:hypothetical protein